MCELSGICLKNMSTRYSKLANRCVIQQPAGVDPEGGARTPLFGPNSVKSPQGLPNPMPERPGLPSFHFGLP